MSIFSPLIQSRLTGWNQDWDNPELRCGPSGWVCAQGEGHWLAAWLLNFWFAHISFTDMGLSVGYCVYEIFYLTVKYLNEVVDLDWFIIGTASFSRHPTFLNRPSSCSYRAITYNKVIRVVSQSKNGAWSLFEAIIDCCDLHNKRFWIKILIVFGKLIICFNQHDPLKSLLRFLDINEALYILIKSGLKINCHFDSNSVSVYGRVLNLG